jgi:hypothetical protein
MHGAADCRPFFWAARAAGEGPREAGIDGMRESRHGGRRPEAASLPASRYHAAATRPSQAEDLIQSD